MTADDHRPAYEDMPQYRSYLRGHHHICQHCGRWWHEDGDSGCVGVPERSCPTHEFAALPAQLTLA